MSEVFTDLESFYSETLAQSIDDNDTTLVASAAPDVSTAFFVLEKNTPNEEIIKMTSRVGASLTVIRGLATFGSTETDAGNGVSHPAGASIEICDAHYYIKQIQAKNSWSYRGDFADAAAIAAITTPETGDTAFARDTGSMYWYNGSAWVTITGGTTPSDASTTVKGITKLATAPASASNPLAVGDNDPRLPTQNENDALVGTSGNAVSSSNKLVDNSDTTGTGLVLRRSVINKGGSGSDGALAISSGTTTVNLAGAAIYIKNYSSIAITGTGALAFSNPHANGVVIILLCTGGVTLTSSATPMIDASSLGPTGGAGGSGTDAAVGTPGKVGYFPGGGTFASGVGAVGSVGPGPYSAIAALSIKKVPLSVGSGGVGGGAGSDGGGSRGNGGTGGRGGGALFIYSAGALNFTTGTISVAGGTGTVGANSAAGGAGAGGGGGGGGSCVILCGSITANTGTVTTTGGTGGSGGTGVAGSGGGGGAGGSSTGSSGDGGNGTSSGGIGGQGGGGGGGGVGGSAGSAGSSPSAGQSGGGGGGGGAGLSFIAIDTYL